LSAFRTDCNTVRALTLLEVLHIIPIAQIAQCFEKNGGRTTKVRCVSLEKGVDTILLEISGFGHSDRGGNRRGREYNTKNEEE
jgi:hypothetical protein